MPEAVLHGAVAALLAFVLVLIVGSLPLGKRPTLADAAMIALIVFCVAFGHTLGIAAGAAPGGIVLGALAGVVLAGAARAGLRHRA